MDLRLALGAPKAESLSNLNSSSAMGLDVAVPCAHEERSSSSGHPGKCNPTMSRECSRSDAAGLGTHPLSPSGVSGPSLGGPSVLGSRPSACSRREASVLGHAETAPLIPSPDRLLCRIPQRPSAQAQAPTAVGSFCQGTHEEGVFGLGEEQQGQEERDSKWVGQREGPAGLTSRKQPSVKAFPRQQDGGSLGCSIIAGAGATAATRANTQLLVEGGKQSKKRSRHQRKPGSQGQLLTPTLPHGDLASELHSNILDYPPDGSDGLLRPGAPAPASALRQVSTKEASSASHSTSSSCSQSVSRSPEHRPNPGAGGPDGSSHWHQDSGHRDSAGLDRSSSRAGTPQGGPGGRSCAGSALQGNMQSEGREDSATVVGARLKRHALLPKDHALALNHRQDSDGYVWRKYSHKLLQGTQSERVYYYCSEKESQGCTARKIVDRPRGRQWRGDSICDVVTVDGEHNHPPPTQKEEKL